VTRRTRARRCRRRSDLGRTRDDRTTDEIQRAEVHNVCLRRQLIGAGRDARHRDDRLVRSARRRQSHCRVVSPNDDIGRPWVTLVSLRSPRPSRATSAGRPRSTVRAGASPRAARADCAPAPVELAVLAGERDLALTRLRRRRVAAQEVRIRRKLSLDRVVVASPSAVQPRTATASAASEIASGIRFFICPPLGSSSRPESRPGPRP
jgi:hypothetical protein